MTAGAPIRSPGAAAGPGGPVDLHLHSTASDGTVPPAEVVRHARMAGVAGISLTDHDTVGGLDEAAAEAAALGLEFLAGAELSANEPGRSVHLLAFGFDPADRGLREFMEVYRADRIRRAREMVDRLQGLGLPLRWERIQEETGAAAPTRAHVARALLRAGLVSTIEEVFRRYLSRGRPAFVEKRPTPPAEAIARVHAAGGVAILAHPGREHDEPVIRRWVEGGLDGLEVRHPANDPGVRARLDALAGELGLLRSGGSDWHGPGTHRAAIGSQDVPGRWMDEIRARCGAAVERNPEP